MVEIFKTNMQSVEQSIKLLTEIKANFPKLNVNFDLEDCDKILRVKGDEIPIDEIEEFVLLEGCFCQVIL